MPFFHSLLTIFLVCTATSLEFLSHSSGEKQLKLAQKVSFNDSDKILLAQQTHKLIKVAEHMLAVKKTLQEDLLDTIKKQIKAQKAIKPLKVLATKKAAKKSGKGKSKKPAQKKTNNKKGASAPFLLFRVNDGIRTHGPRNHNPVL